MTKLNSKKFFISKENSFIGSTPEWKFKRKITETSLSFIDCGIGDVLVLTIVQLWRHHLVWRHQRFERTCRNLALVAGPLRRTIAGNVSRSVVPLEKIQVGT